ncbi:hypothetical protein GUJ93_ZPchr0012g20270 [Zizania palustris]|uniref:Transcription repressor n=1 Tax=Zizania palustris TaxID=103762 RepID=A0A8J5WNB0_ZIZPA|nr:hypothetical protein GUJ93_ZPchr0012g20270 [Zizania palustris]
MPRNAAERTMLGCFHGGKRPTLVLPPAAAAAAAAGTASYEEAGSTSAASTSVGTGSPPSSASASTSSPAFLDDDLPPLYLDDCEAEADVGGLSTAIASRRLLPASPGRSNSIVDSAEHAAPSGSGGASSSGGPVVAPAGAAVKGIRVCGDEPARPVAVSTASPRAEFLKSMTEMVDAMGLDARRGSDRARLHELLLCYIALNDRDALPDILGAFTDLLFALDANGPVAAADRIQEGGSSNSSGSSNQQA